MRLLASILGLMTMVSTTHAYNGHLTFLATQRFFSSDLFGNVNGFSTWWAPQFEVQAGIYELPFGIEPYVGFSFIRNSASLCSLDPVTAECLQPLQVSQDRVQYEFYTGSLGLRWQVWNSRFFPVVPFTQAGMTYRFGRVKKMSLRADGKRAASGGDVGGEIGGGLMLTFMTSDAKRISMKEDYGLKDFGLVALVRYLPAGLFRHGLGNVSTTGGWDFGLGLTMDW